MSKVHYSVISIYPVFVGLPIGVLGTLYSLFNSKISKIVNIEPIDALYSCASGFIATISLIFLNLALKYEDAAKISILRTTGVLFSFAFQYAILRIDVDFLGLLGAFFIIFATLTVILVKLYSQNKNNDDLKYNIFCKFLLIKF